jgi:tetratricopeptide (TPR) repeat protein
LYKARQFRDAERILTIAIKLDPSQTDARRWLAATYHDIGAMDNALKQLAVIAEQAPTDPRPHRLMGLIHKDFEAYGKAIDEYRESLKRDSDQPDEQQILVELAECLLHERRHVEAMETLGRCPRSGRVLTLEAECRYAQGDAASAGKLVDEAMKLEPKQLAAMQMRATLDMEANDAESAVRILRQAVQDYPKDFRLRYQLARAYQRLGEQESAQEQLDTMQELRKLRLRFTELHKQAIAEPANVEIRYQLGVVAGQLDEPELAQSWFTATLGMDPKHAGAREALQDTSAQSASPPKDGVDNSGLDRPGS